MLLEKKIQRRESEKRSRTYTTTTYVYGCDECGKQFERQHRDKRSMQFCTRECYQISMKAGVANQFVRDRLADPEIRSKTRERTIEAIRQKYGVDSVFSLPEIQRKCRNTCLERYGSVSSMGNEEVQKKKETTFLNKYGTRVPIAECATVVSKSLETQMQRYGSVYQQTSEFKEQFVSTCIERFGVPHPMLSIDVKSRIDFRASWKKQHETKKRNGTYAASRIELEFGKCLVAEFGIENIDYQVIVNNWVIDFYVRNLDVYVQFDGVYWHGLDRPYERIVNSSSARDKRIIETCQNDAKQVAWFSEQNLKLVRVTDYEFKSDRNAAIQKLKMT